MNRKTKSPELVTLEYIDAKFDRHMEQWRQDRQEMEARLAAERKEAAAYLDKMETRVAADRKETAERLAADREEAEARLAAERQEARREFNSQRRWLIANFAAVVVGMGGIFIALLIAM